MIIFIKNLIEYFIILVFNKLLPPKNNIDHNSILFINTGQIGDLVVSSIILENPGFISLFNKVNFIIKQEYKELFANYSGNVKFVPYNYKKYKYSLKYKYRFLKKIRSRGFDTAINLTTARGILNDELTILSGADELYCLNANFRYLGKFWGIILSKRYTNVITSEIFNEYKKHYELLKLLSGNIYNKINFKNKLTFLTSIEPNLPFIDKDKKIISIAPFATDQIRNWPLINFETVISHFCNEYLIIVIGSAFQKHELKKLQDKYKNVYMAVNLRLSHIAAILAKSNIFIGLDSGVTHIAAKLNIYSIAIIGGGNFGRFFPFPEFRNCICLYHKMDCFGCEWRCKFDKPYCHQNVSVDDVIKAAKKLLAFNIK